MKPYLREEAGGCGVQVKVALESELELEAEAEAEVSVGFEFMMLTWVISMKSQSPYHTGPLQFKSTSYIWSGWRSTIYFMNDRLKY